jgi:L-threonylcarbamoyladenylate synthase
MNIFYWDFLQDLQKVKGIVKNNEIIAGETDTVIGLFGNCTKEVFAALNHIKNRRTKPYIILISSIDKATLFVEKSQHDAFCALSALFWPGPYTIVTKANPTFLYASSDQHEIALRIPDKAEIRLFLSSFLGVFSTSANRSGDPIPTSFEAIHPAIKKAISGYIKFKTTPQQENPSTIIRLHGHHISVLRGFLSEQQKEWLEHNGFSVLTF